MWMGKRCDDDYSHSDARFAFAASKLLFALEYCSSTESDDQRKIHNIKSSRIDRIEQIHNFIGSPLCVQACVCRVFNPFRTCRAHPMTSAQEHRQRVAHTFDSPFIKWVFTDSFKYLIFYETINNNNPMQTHEYLNEISAEHRRSVTSLRLPQQ